MLPKFLQPERVPFSSVEILLAGVLLAPAPPMVCAYCPDFDPAAIGNLGASHGICPACVARFEAGAVAVVEVALVPVSIDTAGVVDVALVPTNRKPEVSR